MGIRKFVTGEKGETWVETLAAAICMCLFFMTLMFLFVGCVRTSYVTAPAPASETTALTVRALWYAAHPDRPLAGAIIRIDGQIAGITDESGGWDGLAPVGREIRVSVERWPYVPMIPWAESTLQPDSHETWTFYFELSQ